jgi:hypothetical protein
MRDVDHEDIDISFERFEITMGHEGLLPYYQCLLWQSFNESCQAKAHVVQQIVAAGKSGSFLSFAASLV